MAETNIDNSCLSFNIKIDGEDLAEIAEVISIHLEKQFCKIPTAQVTLYYGSLLNNTFADDGDNAIAVGSEIEISASEDTCLFKGVVVRKSVSLSDRKSLLTLTVKNNAFRMAQCRWNYVFTNVTDSDIIEQLIQKYSIGCEVESTSCQHELVTQCNCTDWDFMNLKADANGMLVLADDDKISVMTPRPSDASQEINGYDSILSFDAQMDGRNAFSGIKASSWNYNAQEKQDVEVQNSSDGFKQGNVSSAQLADKLGNEVLNLNFLTSFVETDTMTGKMTGMMMRNNLSRIIGKVKVYGIMPSKPGECVTFSGVGDSFNGDAYITSVEMDYTNGAWTTTLGFGMEETPYFWAYDDINAAPSSGLGANVYGLQLGKVVAVAGDPSEDFRIRVSLPCFDGDSAEVWARVAMSDAGDGRGIFFIPEVDDEVVIGFVDQNPNNPIVLGTLHCNKRSAPQPLSDDNNLKGIYLKSQIKLEFDEENKIVNLETPGGNKLVLNDKDGKIELADSNGNQITMDNQGITIKSAGKVSVEATQDMDLKGANVTVEAQAQLKASGSAQTEVSSSGIMVVKGSLVQIN